MYNLEADTTNGIYTVEGFGMFNERFTQVDVYDLEVCYVYSRQPPRQRGNWYSM